MERVFVSSNHFLYNYSHYDKKYRMNENTMRMLHHIDLYDDRVQFEFFDSDQLELSNVKTLKKFIEQLNKKLHHHKLALSAFHGCKFLSNLRDQEHYITKYHLRTVNNIRRRNSMNDIWLVDEKGTNMQRTLQTISERKKI